MASAQDVNETRARPSRLTRIRTALTPREWLNAGAMTAAAVALHVIGWGVLLAIIVPHRYSIGTSTLGATWVVAVDIWRARRGGSERSRVTVFTLAPLFS